MLTKRFPRIVLFPLLLGSILALLAGCRPQSQPAASAPADLPAAMKQIESAPGGWKASEALKTYTKDTLFDLMDGQSDAFFVYGFQQAVVQRFTNSSGGTLIVAIFQVDSTDSAYGLNSANRGPQAIALGSGGTASPGQRLSFWQDRYFVQLTSLKPVPEADLEADGQAISAALPKGGSAPAILARLPKTGLAQDPPPLYFHQELSIQDRVFLGGENKLGLGPDTGCVLARYQVGQLPADLLICEYPDDQRAAAGLAGLEGAGLSDLAAAKRSGTRLAALFGGSDAGAAEQLVEAAVK